MMIGDHRLRLRMILSSTNLKMGERRAIALSALNLELVKLRCGRGWVLVVVMHLIMDLKMVVS